MSKEEKKISPVSERTFLDDLYEDLKDPRIRVGYLQACLEEFDDAVYYARDCRMWLRCGRGRRLWDQDVWTVKGHALESTCCGDGELLA